MIRPVVALLVMIATGFLGGCGAPTPIEFSRTELSPSFPATPAACLAAFQAARAEQATLIRTYGPLAPSQELARPEAGFQSVLSKACQDLPELRAASLTSIGLLKFWRGDLAAARNNLLLARAKASSRFPLIGFVSILETCDLVGEEYRLSQIRSAQMLGAAARRTEELEVLRGIVVNDACPALRDYVIARRREALVPTESRYEWGT